MSYTPTAESFTVDHDGPRRAVLPLAIVSFSVAAFWTVMGAHQVREAVVVIAIAALVTAGVYGFVLPRALKQQSAPGLALTLSVLAALLIVPAFWSGLPMVLGTAGALLGYAGRNASTGSRRSIVALAIGVLAVVAYLASYVTDQFFG